MEFEIIDKEYAPPMPAVTVSQSKEAAPTFATQSETPAKLSEHSAPLKSEIDHAQVADLPPQETPQPVSQDSAPEPAPAQDVAPHAVAASLVAPPTILPMPQLPDVPQLGPGDVAVPQVPQPTGEIVPTTTPQRLPQMAATESLGAGSGPADGHQRQSTQSNTTVATVKSPATAKTPTPGPARRELNTQSLSRFLDAQGPQRAKSRLNSAAIGSAIGSAVPRGTSGLRLRERVNLEQMIRSQITPCWNPPVADDGNGAVLVLMRIRLDRSGAIAGFPALVSLRGPDTPYARAVVSSVRRAILQCSPLKLPPELYEAWSDVELNFDPKDVL